MHAWRCVHSIASTPTRTNCRPSRRFISTRKNARTAANVPLPARKRRLYRWLRMAGMPAPRPSQKAILTRPISALHTLSLSQTLSRVGGRGCNRSRKAVPQGQQSWENMGRGHVGEGSLAHRQGIRQKHRSSEVSTSRSAPDLCSALSLFGRRVGADPIPFWARLDSNDRTVFGLHAANSVSS